MTFQFLCPQGHLLQGDEAHMGMQCQCPQCGTAFIIPTVDVPAADRPAYTGSVDDMIAPFRESPLEQPAMAPSDRIAPLPGMALDRGPDAARGLDASSLDMSELATSELGQAAVAETFLHIPCPNGHELETPLDMVGQRVLCPHCNIEFRLKREKSVEFLREQELIDRQRARFWFQLSILVGTFVVVLLLAMVVMMIVS